MFDFSLTRMRESHFIPNPAVYENSPQARNLTAAAEMG